MACVPPLDAEEVGLAASLGADLKYLVAGNRAIGVEVKLIYHRLDIEVDGREVGINADYVLTLAGIRVYF